MKPIATPCNPHALPCVHRMMAYLADLSGHGILTGQHTKTRGLEDLHYIRRLTGKEPALLGFELLSYSPNINYRDTDDECMEEVAGNYGTLRQAWEWAAAGGVITFTWHWFSPLGGRSKAFFTQNTDFDIQRAITPGTPENKALLSDMDVMAGLLRPFCDAGIPILWRPLHEADGTWFWWGAKGAEPVKALWRMMYERFTNLHGLNNLIWVWNAPKKEFYPGDDVVDIISRDIYPPEHLHAAHTDKLDELRQITPARKIALIGEIGSLPDISALAQEKAEWVSYMTWCDDFCMSERWTSNDVLRAMYSHPWAITKDQLPELY
ncbi:MAG: beta-mannosidase [Clostridia bacterium]|nr:beta-mannosidase [Clostridia bacterium]